MQFRIADTFTDSLSKLTGDEQKAVKTAAFDLPMNPAHPGLKLHQVDRAKDKDFWSVRVSRDIRLIVHRTASSFLLCYVDHHDAAYQWAERRRLERHPTGAVKLTKSSSIDPQDAGLEPAVNPPCWGSETAVSLNLTIPSHVLTTVGTQLKTC